jgi:hypothetical protein
MAIHRESERTRTRAFIDSLVRNGLIVVFTGVETVALILWLALVRDAPVVSRASAVGLGILAIGLLVEHFLTDLAVNGFGSSASGGKAIAFSASETALWAVWLVVAERVGGLVGLLVAGVVLAVLLVPQHSIEDNVLRGRGFLSDLLNLRTLGFSVIEAAGATLWLLFVLRGDLIEPFLVEVGVSAADPAVVGAGILAGALLIEHLVGVQFSRRKRSER